MYSAAEVPRAATHIQCLPFPADSCDAIEVPLGNPGAIVEARQDVGLRCGCRGLAVAPAQLSSWRPPAPTAPCEIIPLPKPRPKRWRAEPDAAAPPQRRAHRYTPRPAQPFRPGWRLLGPARCRAVCPPRTSPTPTPHRTPALPPPCAPPWDCQRWVFFCADWRCKAQPGCRPILIASYFLASLSWALAFSILALAT